MAALCSMVLESMLDQRQRRPHYVPGRLASVAMFDFKHDQYSMIDLKRWEEIYSFNRDGNGLYPLFLPYLFVESGIH